MKLKILILLIICGLYVEFTYSQEMVPPIQNYKPSEYKAGSQNWDIALDEHGLVYVANNEGLLIYDGFNWSILPLESQSIIRSVYPVNGRVYTGSYNEFGYWETNDKGGKNYQSLSHLMKEFDLQSEEFWEILSIDEVIYFRSFGAVYKYENQRIEKISNITSTALGDYRGDLIIARRNQDILKLNGSGKLEPLDGDLSMLQGKNIIDIASHGDTLFIGSRSELFIYSNKKLKKYPDNNLAGLIATNELNHIVSVSDNEIVLGTIKNGILRHNLKSATTQIINRTSGLQNNTVLGMDYKKGRLWLAMDKGVDMINLEAPINFYTDYSGELGTVYDLANYKGDIYIASNTGVYNFKNDQLNQIKGSGDHTWNLEITDGILYANHNTGTYIVKEDKFIPVDTRTGSFSIDKLRDGSERLLISNYTGLSLYDPETGMVRELDSISFPVKKIIYEGENTWWAANPYEGLYKINTNQDLEIVKVNKIPSLRGAGNFKPSVYNINNQVVLYLDGQWYKYNTFKDDFEEFEELKNFRNQRLIYNDKDNYVFVNEDEATVNFSDLKEKELPIPLDDFNYRLVKSYENLIRLNDSVYYLTLNDGFARINTNKLKGFKDSQWISKPYIQAIEDLQSSYSVNETNIIPYRSSGNLNIRVGMPVSDALDLRYRLTGEESRSGIVENGVINFRNLSHGKYELSLIATGSGKDVVTNHNFSIAAPWYLTNAMKALYILIVLVLTAGVYLLNKRKLRKHQLRLEEKFEKEHNERLIRMEKEKLLNEIDLKRKELANTTMIAAKKNEVLMEIQNELNKDKTKFSNQFRLKHIMTKINQAVKNKDEWQIFETNFNELHEDFFRELLEKYPKLTGKDLKLCAYLKMNLSSKEIAPLMGISVRGVEVHRYRLRKKLKLSGEINLTKFLIKNF